MSKQFGELELNRSVGNILRLGVILSVSVSIIGFIKLFLEGFRMPDHYKDLKIESSQDIFKDFWQALTHLEGIGFIQLGVFLLILTPILRVIFALIGFYKEKDYTYTFISLIVLIIISISFFTGFG